ncbi:MAG: hypothetical protein R2932_40550 [Caldilineaceae bacterium]
MGAGNHGTCHQWHGTRNAWAKLGANLIVHGMDISAFRNGMRQDIDAIKAALREDVGSKILENINI